jgi:hypothetical protein
VRAVLLTHHPVDGQFARRLAARLADAAAAIWLDPARRVMGDSLAGTIGAAVAQAADAVPVLSGDSLGSPWMDRVRAEPPRSNLVLAVRGDCALPGSLADSRRAEFRDAERFEASADALLATLGLSHGHGSGVAVEWMREGPAIFARGVFIAPGEGRALLDAWTRALPEHVARERTRGGAPDEVGPAAALGALASAFAAIGGRVPGPLELAAGTSEASRTFNLLYLFFLAIYPHAGAAWESRA